MGAAVEARWSTDAARSTARPKRKSRATGGRTVKSLTTRRAATSVSERTRAVEALFAKFAQTQDEGLREELIRTHAKLAEKVARNFLASGEPFEDVAQEAYIGLVKAVDSFDPTLGIKFSTYATHKISGQIRHYLRDRTSVIRQPGWLHERRRKLARATEKLRQELNREPNVGELAAEAGITEQEVRDVQRTKSIFRVGSLDSPEGRTGEDDEVPLDRKRIQALRAEGVSLPVEEKLVLREAIRKLKRIERWVVYALYYRGLTQTEVANQLNISCNYVSHILRNALGRLRQILASEEVKESHLRSKTQAQAERAALRETTSPIDPLTKLFSAKSLRERVEEEMLRASRYGYEITVLAVDIDGLGEINDTHGFAQGDLLLAELGNLLRAQLRKVDVASRYVGGTFMLMLPHTGERGKRGAAQRYMRAISHLEIRTRMGKLTPSVSIGVATYPLDGDSKEELIQTALDGLQVAKSAGGNCAYSIRDKRRPSPGPTTSSRTGQR
jgi:RNA polymerase sigma-B factor